MEESIEILTNIYTNIIEIPEDRRYWLVRTDSGTYYDDFKNEGFISIGWNEFSNRDFFLNVKADDAKKDLILEKYPKNQPGRIYNQIRRFIYDIKIGDIVMIPNENSKIISFGVIESELYSRDASKGFIKSRKVKWVQHVERDSLDPYLFKMMQSHQTINNADDYARYIDRTMYNLFSKGDKCYLHLPVGKKGDLPAYNLSKFLDSLLCSVELSNQISIDDFDEKYNVQDLDIKVNVQSEGWAIISATKKLITKVFVTIDSALNENENLFNDITEMTSEQDRDKRREELQEIKKGMKAANARLPKEK